MGYFGSKATTGLSQALIVLMPPHSVCIESHLGGGALMKRKPAAVRSIGIDRDKRALEALDCDYPVELVHGCSQFLPSVVYGRPGDASAFLGGSVHVVSCSYFQPTDISRPLRSVNAELCQLTPQSIDRLRALAHQQIVRAEQHSHGLLLFRLHRHDPHGQELCRFGGRLGVSHTILLPFHEGLHVDQRDQLDLVSKCLSLAPPIVTARAGLHRDATTWLPGEEVEHLHSAQLLVERDGPIISRPVQLKDVVRQVDPDDGNFLHRCLLP